MNKQDVISALNAFYADFSIKVEDVVVTKAAAGVLWKTRVSADMIELDVPMSFFETHKSKTTEPLVNVNGVDALEITSNIVIRPAPTITLEDICIKEGFRTYSLKYLVGS